jgi:hypothetical protein
MMFSFQVIDVYSNRDVIGGHFMHTPGGEETPLGPADDGGVPNYESKKYFA